MTIQDDLTKIFKNFDTYTLHIVDGLPGSGKTSLAMKIFDYYAKEDDQIYYLNLDNKDYKNFSTKPNYGFGNHESSLLIDGLFSDTKDFFRKFDNSRLLKYWYNPISKVVIHSFIPNIENCIINDMGRREQDSIRSIHASKDFITKDSFLKEVKKSDRKHLFIGRGVFEEIEIAEIQYEVPVYDKSKIDSSLLYSSWKTLNNDDDVTFTELDSYLESNYPNTSFLQYKKLQSFIKKNTTTEYDYYDHDGTNFIQYSIKYSDIESVLGAKQ